MESNIQSPLRVLHLEDNARDFELVQATLEADGLLCHFRQAQSGPEFEAAIAEGGWDIILSDYGLPSYDGFTALRHVRENAPDLPFILFSGTIGEEVAVESLKCGATDYVIKHRPERLSAAVRRALAEANERDEAKRLEASRRESDARFLSFMDHSPAVAFMKDDQGRYVFINRTFERLFGMTSEELRGKTDFDFLPKETARQMRENDARVLASSQSMELTEVVPAPDGVLHHWMVCKFPFQDAGGENYVGGVALDSTARLKAEAQIRAQAALLDRARDAILVRDFEDRITYWNKGAERVFGWTTAEAVGQNASKLLFAEVPAELASARKGTLEKGEWTGELPCLTKAGKKRTVQTHWSLIRDDAGSPAAKLIIGTDITEKKQLEAQFLRTQRLESIGTLASGIAHDLNNILAPILMSAPMLRWGLKPEQFEKTLLTLEASAQRGADLVKQLLTFGRGVEGERGPVQARHLIQEIVKMAQETFPKNITSRSKCPPDLWPLNGDATQLHQVLLNLCVNARDAMPRGGTILVSAENIQISAADAGSSAETKPGPYVLVRVEDTGQGILPEVMERIFDPFFTTKAPGKGTGLGLSTVLGIVKSHQGFVKLESQAGKGTSFQVYLPAAAQESNKDARSETSSLLRGNGETILVVDDETAILDTWKKTLQAYGYQVITAQDGVEALTHFAQRGEEIDLVLTDLLMPILDGVGLVRCLKKMNEAVKIIVSTGLDSEAEQGGMLREAQGLGVTCSLRKPYKTEEMLHELHQALLPAL